MAQPLLIKRISVLLINRAAHHVPIFCGITGECEKSLHQFSINRFVSTSEASMTQDVITT